MATIPTTLLDKTLPLLHF